MSALAERVHLISVMGFVGKPNERAGLATAVAQDTHANHYTIQPDGLVEMPSRYVTSDNPHLTFLPRALCFDSRTPQDCIAYSNPIVVAYARKDFLEGLTLPQPRVGRNVGLLTERPDPQGYLYWIGHKREEREQYENWVMLSSSRFDDELSRLPIGMKLLADGIRTESFVRAIEKIRPIAQEAAFVGDLSQEGPTVTSFGIVGGTLETSDAVGEAVIVVGKTGDESVACAVKG